MPKLQACSLGGLAKAKKINDGYLSNPNKCLNCNKPILRKEGEKLADTKKKKFCNQSCSAKYHNNLRKKPSKCKICGEEISNGRKRCDKCLVIYISKISHILKKDTTHPKIRSHARTVFRKANPEIRCVNCGFTHFTEVCHKKAIAEFSDDTPLSIINDLSNLTQLCPNCHWDFDHNISIKL